MANLKKYYVSYYDKNDDLTTVWTMAASEQEAIENVKDEYWDVVRITYVRKA